MLCSRVKFVKKKQKKTSLCLQTSWWIGFSQGTPCDLSVSIWCVWLPFCFCVVLCVLQKSHQTTNQDVHVSTVATISRLRIFCTLIVEGLYLFVCGRKHVAAHSSSSFLWLLSKVKAVVLEHVVLGCFFFFTKGSA